MNVGASSMENNGFISWTLAKAGGSAFKRSEDRRFRNIEITTPEGELLWKGVGTAEPSRPNLNGAASNPSTIAVGTRDSAPRAVGPMPGRSTAKDDESRLGVMPDTPAQPQADNETVTSELLRKGTIWSGNLEDRYVGGDVKTHRLTLTIIERKGKQFKALFKLGENQLREVRGTVGTVNPMVCQRHKGDQRLRWVRLQRQR